MKVNQIYSVPFSRESCLIIQCDSGLYALKKHHMQCVKELPPSAIKYSIPSFPFQSFFKSRFDLPSKEHMGVILGGYYSKADSVYFFENGASIYMIHDTPLIKSRIYFFSEDYSKQIGLVLHTIKNNHLYTEIPRHLHPKREDYPFDCSYIVVPGFVKQESLINRYPVNIKEHTLTIDLVQGYLHPIKNPKEIEPFIYLPQYLSDLLNLKFNFAHWYQILTKENLPCSYNDCVHPFFMSDKCVAEIIIIADHELDAFEHFPYNDSYALTIRYNENLHSYIHQLINKIISNYPNIILCPYHLCEILR